MDTIHLPQDFKDFLKLLMTEQVDFLVIGGYAVAYHGYARATEDIDVWIAANSENADRVISALRKFGFSEKSLDSRLFSRPGKTARIGVAPLRIEILTRVSGLDFKTAKARAVIGQFEDVSVPLLSLEDLRINKQASGRQKDVVDLDHLPKSQ
jgi:hypothetical protein